MGKVYDALRRAEAQRSRQAATPPAPVEASADWLRGPAEHEDTRGSWMQRVRSRLRLRRAARHDDASAINKRRIALLQPDSFVTEQFRTLRARLDSLAAERPIRTLTVTSALPGEGKTTAAINLAFVTALGVGRRILLVDCDMRKPKIHRALNLRPEFGLAEVLTERATLDQAVLELEGTTLQVLPVRSTPPNPSELLSSGRMRGLVGELAEKYDQVIFDVPPTLGLADAKAVSELTDGVVMVVRAGETPQAEIVAALDVLDRRRVLGVVLNGTETRAALYGY